MGLHAGGGLPRRREKQVEAFSTGRRRALEALPNRVRWRRLSPPGEGPLPTAATYRASTRHPCATGRPCHRCQSATRSSDLARSARAQLARHPRDDASLAPRHHAPWRRCLFPTPPLRAICTRADARRRSTPCHHPTFRIQRFNISCSSFEHCLFNVSTFSI